MISGEKKRYPAVVICHNCGIRTTALHFYTEHLPDEIAKYDRGWDKRDIGEIQKITEEGNPSYTVIEELTEEDKQKLFEEELPKAKEKVGNFIDKCTYSVMDNPEALFYLRNRFVPEKYIAEMRLLCPEFHDHNTFRYSYFRDYIIVPFVDGSDNKTYYFHSRRYRNLNYGKMSRYLMCPYRPDDPDIKFYLNELRVDVSNTVVVTEGTIDSLHIRNSIAVNGIKRIRDEHIRFFEYRFGGEDNIIYALDNEMIDLDSKLKAKELLKMKKRVFLWSLLAKDNPNVANIKDFNALCSKAKRYEFPFPVIEKYTVNNVSHLM